MRARPTGWGGKPVAAPALADVRDAAVFLHDKVVRTPLLALGGGADGADVFLKPEVLQPIGSFKLRGVLNWARHLSEAERARGLSTCSAGNTAQALGYAARQFGVPARSLLPDNVPASKVAAIEAYGVTPVRVPREDLILYMLEERWRQEPYCYLNPWGDPHMIAGSGTVGIEIWKDLAAVDTVFLPVGGGGLAAGAGSVLKALKPSLRIVAAQAEASPALHAALAAGRSVWVESRPTICEGTAVPVLVDEMLPLLRAVVDEVALVSEDAVGAAIRRLALCNHLVVEGAGALAVAAVLATPRARRGLTVCIVSGGSIGAERLAAAVTSPDPGSPAPLSSGTSGTAPRPSPRQ